MTEVDEKEVLAAKERLTPAMPRKSGDYRCVLCGTRQDVDGTCPNDGLPLRRMPTS
jgi:hypothetical protein